MPITNQEINEIIDGVKNELHYLDESEKNIISRSRNSFIDWVRNTVREIGRTIGLIISFPIRVIEDFFEGLWDGLFRKY